MSCQIVKAMGGIRTASKGVSTIFCIGFIILSTVWISCRAVPVIPDLPFECYSSTGDLNLGVLTDPTRGGSDGGYCGNERFYTRSMQNMEAIIWTLNRINQREDLLPNITLGYVITNACNNKMVALARSTYFIPEPEKANNETFRVQTDLEKNCAGGPMTFDVVGVIGNGFSPTAVMAAGLLGLYQVAYLDTLASSDDLSDKRWYPYYLRLVPPDRYLVSAMMDFIAHHKWTYASIIYSEGSWGENAEKLVQATAKEMGLCIPVAERVRIGATREDLEPVLEKLLTHSNARVVINFLYDSQRPVLWALIGERNLTGKFIWVAGDSMAHEDEGEAADGTFVMFQVSKPVPEYAKHYLSLTPKNTPDNPWMPKLWEELYECTWDDVDIDNITNIGDNSTENGVRSCNAIEDKPFMNRRVRDVSSIFCDTVLVFAHAMHALITDQCPEAFQNKDILKTCIHRPDILAYLRATDLEGYNGRTQFDENGDKFGQYSIRQYFHDNPDLFTEVAFWDQMTDTLTFYPDDIKWDIFSRGSSSEDGIPESVCSQPCKPREYAIRQELACCWECLTCRDTEILVEVRNKTRCDRCPVNMWPDDLTATTCEVIDPTYLTWGDPASIALVLGTLAILGLTIATMLWFIKHRRIKLVKASSKDLSGLILFGILLANLTVPFFIVRPSLFWCSISRAGFGISVTLIYGPLLVKTTRIYRIFAAGKNGTGKPRFISNRAQLVAAMLLLLIQVGCTLLI